MTDGPKPLRKRIRVLTQEEVKLWVEVTKSVAPKRGAKLPSVVSAKKAEAPPAPTLEPSKPKREKPEIKKVPASAKALPLAPIERRLKQRLSRGRSDVDAKVDLHGLRQDEAHSVLRGFLLRASHNHARIVLVVTGKGTRSGADDGWRERGVLRRSVPHWLAEPELRHIVLGFEEASASHGGSGALYVRLRNPARISQGAKQRT